MNTSPGKLINVNITVCDRIYPMKVNPVEEETVRKAATKINEPVRNFQNQYAAKDKQDYLAMCALTTMVENLNHSRNITITDRNLEEKLSVLNSQLDSALQSS